MALPVCDIVTGLVGLWKANVPEPSTLLMLLCGVLGLLMRRR